MSAETAETAAQTPGLPNPSAAVPDYAPPQPGGSATAPVSPPVPGTACTLSAPKIAVPQAMQTRFPSLRAANADRPDHPSPLGTQAADSEAGTGGEMVKSLVIPQPEFLVGAPIDASPPPQIRSGHDPAAPTVRQSTPADQVGAALIGVMKSADGTRTVTIRLEPVELGFVHIRIDQTAEGTARVTIAAERPETLELLRLDQRRLHQVLDQAGIASDGRSVSFQVAPPQPAASTGSRPDGTAADRSGGESWRHGDEPRPDRGADPGPHREQARARWFRAGLDITA